MPLRRLSPPALAACLLLPAPSAGQRIGLFFDEAATSCATALEPFGPCQHVWVVAFVPEGVSTGGVLFRLELPVDIQVCDGSLLLPHGLVFDATGDLPTGMDLRFQHCISGPASLVVAEFEVFDRSYGGTRRDLLLHLTGASRDSLVTMIHPQLELCDPATYDPNDPHQNLGVLAAPSVDATFNCTARCGCTTPVAPSTWTAMKRLYEGR